MEFNIGVIRKQNAPASRPPRTIAASAAFASQIAHRCTPRRFTASRAELALAYELPAQVNYFQSARMDIAPSVTIHDHLALPAIVRGLAGRAESAPVFGEAQARALFERLLSRHKRVAAFMESGAAPAAQAHGFPTTRPFSPATIIDAVERILPRTAASQPSADSVGSAQMTASAGADTGWGSRASLPVAPKPFALPEPEVKRVAEQVIREIDHRIIAQRERMGRR
jgi:hypothetical protein